MTNILLITYEEKKKKFLNHLLGSEYFILMCDKEQKIDSLVPLVDLAIVDFSSLGWKSLDIVSAVRQCNSSVMIMGLGREVNKEIVQAAREKGLVEYIDVDKDITFLPAMIREKMEKKMLISRIKGEELSKEASRSFLSDKEEITFSLEEGKFLEEMSRFLIHGYNLNELLQFFLGLLSKMMGITRLCILLKDKIKNTYKIRACLGLTEEIKEHTQLHPKRGLAGFLAKEGTVITREIFPYTDIRTTYEIKQDMKLIRSNVAVPLSPQGKLIGILGLGPKITGDKMSSREIKQVFLFCNQVGLAIQNLLFYEEMRCQKKYIEDVLENATSGVISINVEQKITTCNPRAQKILNLDKSPDLRGKDIRKLPSPLGDLLFETLTQGTSHERKEIYIPAIKHWLGISTSQMKNIKDEVMGGMMIFTDLTPIKYLEEERKKTQKRNFLAQVAICLSQELRNSLVPIKSLAELLPSMYLDEEFQKKLFSVVTQEINRIDNLIERLVFFSQPLHLDKVAESLPNLITETLEKIKNKTSSNRKIQLNTTCEKEDLLVYVDKKAIIKALEHVLNNSIEAVRETIIKIDVRCQTTDKLPEFTSPKMQKKIASLKPAEYIKIEIKDNGPGLSGENVDNIFDPFFTTKNRGIGLGLTISQGIIEEHGGSIVPISERGKGTSIIIYLPRYRPPF